MSTFLIRSATFQSNSYPILIKWLGVNHSRTNTLFKTVQVPEIEPATHLHLFYLLPGVQILNAYLKVE